MIDYVRKMSVKKSSKYGEYGLFEHLLFLFYPTALCFATLNKVIFDTNCCTDWTPRCVWTICPDSCLWPWNACCPIRKISGLQLPSSSMLVKDFGHMYLYKCMCVWVYVCMRVYLCMCVYVCMCVCVCVCVRDREREKREEMQYVIMNMSVVIRH